VIVSTRREEVAYTKTTTFKVRPELTYSINGVNTQVDGSVSASDTRVGQRVEKWREKISKGSDAGSAYSRTAYRYKSSSGVATVKSVHRLDSAVKRDVTVFGVINPNQSISPLSISSPEGEALSRLYNSIKNKQEGMNGLLILGELRETIKMLRRPGEGLLNLFSDYLGTAKGLRETWSRKKGNNRKRFEKAASDLWLEYSFGWKPLISDVRDIATTVARIAYDNALRTDRARGIAGTEGAQVDAPFLDAGPVPSDPAPRFLNARRRRSEISVKYIAGIRASTYGPTDRFTELSRETGLTLSNFVPTVWNLIPYSFLVDYFVNIGDCLESVFTDTSGVNWWCRSERRLDTVDLSSNYDGKTTQSTFTAYDYVIKSATGTGSSLSYVRTSLVRTVGTVVPLPSLTLSLPGLDSTKWWNMLALWKGKAAGTYRS
jgi:hypothetical protein